jgi:hypothetical protein
MGQREIRKSADTNLNFTSVYNLKISIFNTTACTVCKINWLLKCYAADPMRFFVLPDLLCHASHSNKFVIREIFGEIKNSTFGYNTGIIWE